MKLVDHHVATEGIAPYLSECNHLYEYIFARNGIFIHARNEVMEVLAPLVMIRWQSRQIRGLIELTPFLKLPAKVPAEILELIINISREYSPDEVLFYINYLSNQVTTKWKLSIPIQDTGHAFCKPLDNPGYIPIEVHSHNTMQADFSSIDDKDENGLRIYGVLGHIDQEVVDLKVRVSIYGHYSVLPYSFVFEPISEVRDA